MFGVAMQKIASDGLKGCVFKALLADLQQDED